MEEYYAQRAASYDEIYQYPERRIDLANVTLQLQRAMQGKNVLEVACGTGYWTERYAAHANHVCAIDISEEMLAIAKAKQGLAHSDAKQVDYQLADAFGPPQGDFNACVAGFWWSHVKRSDQSSFLAGIQKACGSGAVFMMFDNCYVEGESTSIARTDSEGNTYQIRRLPDDSRHEIIKNFPTDSTLRKKLSQHAQNIRIARSTYYWTLTCVLR